MYHDGKLDRAAKGGRIKGENVGWLLRIHTKTERIVIIYTRAPSMCARGGSAESGRYE